MIALKMLAVLKMTSVAVVLQGTLTSRQMAAKVHACTIARTTQHCQCNKLSILTSFCSNPKYTH